MSSVIHIPSQWSTPEFGEVVLQRITSPRGDTTQPEPPKGESNDLFSSAVTPETKFDTEQFRLNNRELTKELPFIAGDTNSGRGEKRQAPAICKRRARRKRNAQKSEVINTPKLLHWEIQPHYQQRQNLSSTLNTAQSNQNLVFQVIPPPVTYVRSGEHSPFTLPPFNPVSLTEVAMERKMGSTQVGSTPHVRV
ncbi:unnamed protein product [Hymenolepis diminuta]|uniref:Uncharacterized protein n=1 Tax=Hymenolepis diminuta TaxID=6216 RepID=A0A564YNN2_HYMDI|nr:unnamed protein product [Hymenolepis diminuta]